jgi:hypothetical protein
MVSLSNVLLHRPILNRGRVLRTKLDYDLLLSSNLTQSDLDRAKSIAETLDVPVTTSSLFAIAKELFDVDSIATEVQGQPDLLPWYRNCRGPLSDLLALLSGTGAFASAKTRLDSLLATSHDSALPSGNENADSLETFLNNTPGWTPDEEGHPYIYYRDHVALANRRVFSDRIQLSGLCYQHAPIQVARATLSRLRDTDGPEPAVDMTSLMRAQDGEFLRQRLLYDFGGCSLAYLEAITGYPPKAVAATVDSIRTALKESGPLLLHNFHVYQCLLEHSACKGVLSTEPTGELTGSHAMAEPRSHAMAVVGIKGDTLLVQNWWRSLPFVEMSLSYASSCYGGFAKPDHRFEAYSATLELNALAHVEVALLDCAERCEERERTHHASSWVRPCPSAAV